MEDISQLPDMCAPASEVRLVLMSDRHEQHRRVEVPDGDLLIVAGDFTYFDSSQFSVRDFDEWLHTRPHKHKVLTLGNHESKPGGREWRERISGATV